MALVTVGYVWKETSVVVLYIETANPAILPTPGIIPHVLPNPNTMLKRDKGK